MNASDALKRRIVEEPAQVVRSISQATSIGFGLVRMTVAAIRTVVDDLLVEGRVVITGEQIFSLDDNQTWVSLRKRKRFAVPELILTDPTDERYAEWLRLPLDVYCRHPLVHPSVVVDETMTLLNGLGPERPEVWAVLGAWDETFEAGRTYKLSSVGLEAELEKWLVANLERFAELGLPIALAHQQFTLPSGRRPDLLCRVTADTTWGARIGDWVVIELKSRRSTPAALDQVIGYRLEVAESLASPGEDVISVLLTDGATHEEIDRAEEDGVLLLSTAHLGYRYAIADPARVE